MSEAFIGEIRMFPMGNPPTDWLPCNGQILAVQQYNALFSLIGNRFGGNGQTNFALPDLRGRVAMHLVQQSATYALGQQVGSETVALTQAEIPAHNHQIAVSNVTATSNVAAGNVWANTGTVNTYAANSNTTMSSNALAPSGSGAAHSNMQPYSVANFCICVVGIFPPNP